MTADAPRLATRWSLMDPLDCNCGLGARNAATYATAELAGGVEILDERVLPKSARQAPDDLHPALLDATLRLIVCKQKGFMTAVGQAGPLLALSAMSVDWVVDRSHFSASNAVLLGSRLLARLRSQRRSAFRPLIHLDPTV